MKCVITQLKFIVNFFFFFKMKVKIWFLRTSMFFLDSHQVCLKTKRKNKKSNFAIDVQNLNIFKFFAKNTVLISQNICRQDLIIANRVLVEKELHHGEKIGVQSASLIENQQDMPHKFETMYYLIIKYVIAQLETGCLRQI